MSRKICFSAMLQEKKEQQKRAQMSVQTLPSLADFMAEYQQFPNEEFTLKFVQSGSISQCSRGGDFQIGVNPLEAWVSNQAHNKENILDVLQRKPHKDIQKCNMGKNQSIDSNYNSKRGAPKRTSINNIAMKDLCKKFVEDKNSHHSKKQELVWRFGSNNNSSAEQEVGNSRNSNDMTQIPLQSKLAEKKGSKISLDQEKEQKYEGKNLPQLVKDIKNNFKREIVVMAEKIIKDRQEQEEEEEDQEILISQKNSDKESDKEISEKNRIQKARREISEYLKTKEDQKKQEQFNASQEKYPKKQSFQSPNSPVGYSFASDFNSQIRNQELKVNEDISLPNIDEVRSERDELQKHEMHHHLVRQARNVKTRQSKLPEAPEIDKNYIQEIESVAYEPSKPPQVHIDIKASIEEMKQEESVNASLPSQQQEKQGSINQQLEAQKNQQKLEQPLNSVKNIGSLYESGSNRFDFKKVCSPSKKEVQYQYQSKNYNASQYTIGKEDSIKEPSSIQRHQTAYLQQNATNPLLKMSKKSAGSSKGLKRSPNDEPKKMIKITLSPSFHPQPDRQDATVNTFNSSNGRKMMGSRQQSMKSIGEQGPARSGQFQFDLDF